MLVAERGGDSMLARIAIIGALHSNGDVPGREGSGQRNSRSSDRPREPAIHSPYAPGWRTPTLAGILLAVPIPTEERPMLNAAIDFWLLPATLFFDAFLPASKPVAEIIPLTSAAVQRARRRRKRLAAGRLKLDRIFAVNRLL
jgi:hypothetical protein